MRIHVEKTSGGIPAGWATLLGGNASWRGEHIPTAHQVSQAASAGDVGGVKISARAKGASCDAPYLPLRTAQYFGTFGSTLSDHAVMPPARLTAFLKPAFCKNST